MSVLAQYARVHGLATVKFISKRLSGDRCFRDGGCHLGRGGDQHPAMLPLWETRHCVYPVADVSDNSIRQSDQSQAISVYLLITYQRHFVVELLGALME